MMSEELQAVEQTMGSTWARVVERIRAGDPSGMEELYTAFGKGVRFHLWRQFGSQDLDDKVHDVFIIVAQAVQRGELREPERLMGFVRTVLRRQSAMHIDSAMHSRNNQSDFDVALHVADRHTTPEQRAIEQQNEAVAKRLLHSLPWRDREVLIRFYLQEQTPEQICHDLKLTETQFRLTKSRAKARYGELGKARFSKKGLLRG